MSSCETPRHSAPLSRASVNLTIAIFIVVVLSWVGDLAGASSHGVRGGRARTLIGREVQLPLHSSDSSVGLAQLNLSIRLGCQRIFPLLSVSNTPARKVPPGGRSDDTPEDQGVAVDICRAFGGAAAGKPKVPFSEWPVGLP